MKEKENQRENLEWKRGGKKKKQEMNKKIRATTFPNFFKQNNFLLKKIM